MSYIENETFAHFRTQEKLQEIRKSINILKSYGYIIVDLEGKIIDEKIKLEDIKKTK